MGNWKKAEEKEERERDQEVQGDGTLFCFGVSRQKDRIDNPVERDTLIELLSTSVRTTLSKNPVLFSCMGRGFGKSCVFRELFARGIFLPLFSKKIFGT